MAGVKRPADSVAGADRAAKRSHAAPAWLRPGEVSAYERQAIGDLPRDHYLAIRHRVLKHATAANGRGVYYDLAAAAAHINADVNAVVSVHRFLEREGVINAGVSAVAGADQAALLTPELYVDTPQGIRLSTDVTPFTKEEEQALLEAVADLARDRCARPPEVACSEHAFAVYPPQAPIAIPWDAVARRVHRSASECRQWFVQLPLSSDELEGASAPPQPPSAAPPPELTPFAEAGNRVMTTLAFLAAAAPPAAVGRCAEAAMKALAAHCRGEEDAAVGGDGDGDAAAAAFRTFQEYAAEQIGVEERRLTGLAQEAAAALLDAAELQLAACDNLHAAVHQQRANVQSLRDELRRDLQRRPAAETGGRGAASSSLL